LLSAVKINNGILEQEEQKCKNSKPAYTPDHDQRYKSIILLIGILVIRKIFQNNITDTHRRNLGIEQRDRNHQ
jgi:hypothetical protein